MLGLSTRSEDAFGAFGGRAMQDNVIFAARAFMPIHGDALISSTLPLMVSGLGPISSFAAIVACLNQVGPATPYARLMDFATLMSTFCDADRSPGADVGARTVRVRLLAQMSEAIVTIRVARDASAQQAALGDWLSSQRDVRSAEKDSGSVSVAVLVEGAFSPLAAPNGVIVNRIAAGCVCCVGQTVMRVALMRLLRAYRPARLLLLLASGEHVDRVRRMLGEDQFATVLRISGSAHDADSR